MAFIRAPLLLAPSCGCWGKARYIARNAGNSRRDIFFSRPLNQRTSQQHHKYPAARFISSCASSDISSRNDMDALSVGEMPSRYDPGAVESAIYSWWESSGHFLPKSDGGEMKEKPFAICMPPPNVTGALHMGHAMFATLEDILTRFHRMNGRNSLWLPGTDHAGIATQLVVARALR